MMKKSYMTAAIAMLLFGFQCSDIKPPAAKNVPPGSYLLIANTDYATGELAVMDLSTNALTPVVTPVGSDLVVHVENGVPYVINRFGFDSVMKLDPKANFATLYESSTGASNNPQDIALTASGDALVSLYGANSLSLLNTATGVVSAGPSLASFMNPADPDGAPEASGMVASGGQIYLALQNFNQTTWSTVAPGSLLKIDATTLAVTALAPMPYHNPFSDLKIYNRVSDGATLLYTAAVGSWGAADGGVVVYNLTSGAYETAIAETAITAPGTIAQGADVTDVLIVSDTLAFVIIQDANWANSVLAFDPSTWAQTQVLFDGSATFSYIPDMVYAAGKLYIADRTFGAEGIRIFDTATLTEVTTAPIATGLPPASLAVIQF